MDFSLLEFENHAEGRIKLLGFEPQPPFIDEQGMGDRYGHAEEELESESYSA